MKYAIIVLTAILMSLFFFPFEFTFLRGINTKMMAAVLGIAIFAWDSVRNKKGFVVSTEFFVASIIAGAFSLVVFYSVTYNNTYDFAYTSYIVSMWVWLVAAYAVCYIINQVHGTISVKIIANYLIGICAVQCIVALLIDNIPFVKFVVDGLVAADIDKMDQLNRLYGIGASLDVAGTRFAAVLTMIAVLLCHDHDIKSNRKSIAVYVFLFILIAVVGSMISRTTNVGLLLAFAYIVYAKGIWKITIKKEDIRLWNVLIGITLFLVLVCVYLYHHVPAANELLHFAFEGFINWLETGEWRTDSTDILQNMWVLPETDKTWIIGDGYFVDPARPGFYMQTDVGYLRFIYYCGLVGLSVFAAFFLYLSAACYQRFPQEKNLFLLLLVLVFAIWAKVSTDIFLVYALFICIPMVQNHANCQTNKL
jgi:hypothetical protein